MINGCNWSKDFKLDEKDSLNNRKRRLLKILSLVLLNFLDLKINYLQRNNELIEINYLKQFVKLKINKHLPTNTRVFNDTNSINSSMY